MFWKIFGTKSRGDLKWEDKYIYMLGTYDKDQKTGLNKKVGNYVKSMYSMHKDLAWIDANIWRQINNWMFSLYMITAHNILTSLGSNVVSTMVQQELKAWQNQSLFFGDLKSRKISKQKVAGI